ncbi:MAG: PA2779 family protein [Ramlibacter sp.]|jgi:hypothetical protein|nr:PA2779 family protein [Ramlibacter sp.]
MKSVAMKTLCRVLIVSLMSLTFQTASAGMIRTEQAAAAISPDRALVLSTLTRSDVSEQMQAQGLDPAIAAERVAAMTDAEVRTLADNINTAPAGGLSTLAAVVIIGLLVWVIWYRR